MIGPPMFPLKMKVVTRKGSSVDGDTFCPYISVIFFTASRSTSHSVPEKFLSEDVVPQ